MWYILLYCGLRTPPFSPDTEGPILTFSGFWSEGGTVRTQFYHRLHLKFRVVDHTPDLLHVVINKHLLGQGLLTSLLTIRSTRA